MTNQHVPDPLFETYRKQRNRIAEDLDNVRLEVDAWLNQFENRAVTPINVAELEALHGQKAFLLNMLHEADEAFTTQLLAAIAKRRVESEP